MTSERTPRATRAHAPGLPRAVRRIVPLAALAALVAVGLVAGRAALGAQDVVPPAEALRIEGERRPFRHAQHQRVACGDCHRIDERHRTTRRWTARDCDACHHGPAVVVGCTSCHERARFAAPHLTPTAMDLSVWAEPRIRELAFEHDRHAAVGCVDCHRGGMDLPPEHCGSCHTKHHRPEAQCAHCHRAPDPAVHPLAAHATCTGAGCHAPEVTTRPMLSRQFCLVCHEEQRDHRPGRVCVDCHIKPAQPPPETTDHGDL